MYRNYAEILISGHLPLFGIILKYGKHFAVRAYHHSDHAFYVFPHIREFGVVFSKVYI